MYTIDELVTFYLTTKEVYTQERILNDLVSASTSQNYKEIITTMENHSDDTEVEIGIYITEIAGKRFSSLSEFIQEKLKIYTHKDTIESLNEALLILK